MFYISDSGFLSTLTFTLNFCYNYLLLCSCTQLFCAGCDFLKYIFFLGTHFCSNLVEALSLQRFALFFWLPFFEKYFLIKVRVFANTPTAETYPEWNEGSPRSEFHPIGDSSLWLLSELLKRQSVIESMNLISNRQALRIGFQARVGLPLDDAFPLCQTFPRYDCCFPPWINWITLHDCWFAGESIESFWM